MWSSEIGSSIVPLLVVMRAISSTCPGRRAVSYLLATAGAGDALEVVGCWGVGGLVFVRPMPSRSALVVSDDKILVEEGAGEGAAGTSLAPDLGS